MGALGPLPPLAASLHFVRKVGLAKEPDGRLRALVIETSAVEVGSKEIGARPLSTTPST